MRSYSSVMKRVVRSLIAHIVLTERRERKVTTLGSANIFGFKNSEGYLALKFAFMPCCLFADLQTCKLLTPHHFVGNHLIDRPKDYAATTTLRTSLALLSSRFMKVLRYKALFKKFVSILAHLSTSWHLHNSAKFCWN